MTFELIVSVIRRSLPIVLIAMVSLGAAAIGYSLVTPKIYQAASRVIVEPRVRTLTPDEDVVSGLPQRDPTIVDTEVEFLESRTVAEQVVNNEKLEQDSEFGADTITATVDKFSKALNIKRVGETYLIDITVRSHSPQRAAELANATARAYVEVQRARKREATLAASETLRKSIQKMATQLKEAETALAAYRGKSGVYSVNGVTLAEQSASAIADQVTRARADEQAAAAALDAAIRGGAALGAANAQQSVGVLRGQLAQAQQAMSEAAAKYGERHPSYIAAQQRLNEISRAVRDETSLAQSAVRAGHDQQVSVLRADLASKANLRASLEGSLGANSSLIQQNSRANPELAKLDAEASTLRENYASYSARYQQTIGQLGNEQADSNLVAKASVPSKPYTPNLKMNLAMGVLAGLLGGVAISVGMMLFESHLSSASQIEEHFGLEALPALPTLKSSGGTDKAGDMNPAEILRWMLDSPTRVFAEMHKNLVVSLDRPVANGKNQIIAVTSSLPREGKTTASLCLAAMMAHLGKRVLLIDCDQRRRSVTKAMVDGEVRGLGDVLSGMVSAAHVTLGGVVDGMYLLPASPRADADVDIFSGDAFPRLLKELRTQYDVILLDTAPVLPIADTREIVRYVDSVLFLAGWRKTSRKAVEASLNILGRAKAPIAGIALTMVDLNQQAKYGYGDAVFYYGKYKDYYASPA